MNVFIQTLIRQAMIVAGTWLATKGVIESGQVEALSGIVIAVLAFGWRYVEVWMSARALAAAKAAPAELPK
jgi:hypothetical protein